MLIALLLVDTYLCIIINLTSRGIIINSTTRFISQHFNCFKAAYVKLIKRLLLMMNVFKLYPFSRSIYSPSLFCH